MWNSNYLWNDQSTIVYNMLFCIPNQYLIFNLILTHEMLATSPHPLLWYIWHTIKNKFQLCCVHLNHGKYVLHFFSFTHHQLFFLFFSYHFLFFNFPHIFIFCSFSPFFLWSTISSTLPHVSFFFLYQVCNLIANFALVFLFSHVYNA